MKRRRAALDVETRRGWPHHIRWNGRTYRVARVLDLWIVQGRWWAREERRVYFRTRTDGGILELYRSEKGWYLSKVLD